VVTRHCAGRLLAEGGDWALCWVITGRGKKYTCSQIIQNVSEAINCLF